MKKSKLLALTMALLLIVTTVMVSTNVFATENGEVSTRTILDGTQGETTETGGEYDVMPISGETPVETTDTEENHEHNHEDIYEGDLYVFFAEDQSDAGTDYVMDKIVDGNVFIMGQNVTIKGKISGSLFVFATNLTIEEDAYISCHTFAAAENILLKGFCYDMYAACDNFDMANTGIVYRDLKLAGNTANLIGKVGRNLNLIAGTVTAFKDEENSLYVGGNLDYTAKTPIEHGDNIKVGGEVKYTEQKEEETNENVVSDYIYRICENAIFVLVIYALIIFLAPKFAEKSKEYVSTRALLAGGIGAAFTIIVPIIALILLLAGIGLSLAFGTIMVYFIALLINSSIVTIAINEFISSKLEVINTTWKKILMIIPVSAVIFLIRQISIIGSWITVIIFLIGIGITVLYQFDKRKNKEVTE